MTKIFDEYFGYTKQYIDGKLYHYTSIESAKKIFNPIFASDLVFLNHTRWDLFTGENEEGIEFEKIADEVCDELLADGSITENFKSYVLNKIKSKIFHFYLISEESNSRYLISPTEGECYIACFSKEGNNVKNALKFKRKSPICVSLSFSAVELKEQTNKYFGKEYEHFLVEVIYDDEKKKEITKNALIDLFKKFRNGSINFLLDSFVLHAKLIFKPSNLSGEKEVRSIIFKKNTSDVLYEQIVFEHQFLIDSFVFKFDKSTSENNEYIDSLKNASILKKNNVMLIK